MSTELAARGAARVEWIRSRMPLLAATREEFAHSRPLEGQRVGMSLHLEPKTRCPRRSRRAEIVATGNHGSTQDDIVAFLAGGMTGSARATTIGSAPGVQSVIDARPSILLDNADLVAGVVAQGLADSRHGGDHLRRPPLRDELAGQVPFPVIVINDSPLKAIGENRHAVGQSVVESFMRITNLMVPGRRFVVAGYGWCGRGVAQYLRALGGKVAVVEIDDIKAFEAAMDGFRVGDMLDLADWGEVFITATGHPGILTAPFFERVASGAVLANCGHFLRSMGCLAHSRQAPHPRRCDERIASQRSPRRAHSDGMMNLAGREPKDAFESMDLDLLQSLSLERVAATDSPTVPPVPDDITAVSRETCSPRCAHIAERVERYSAPAPGRG